MKHVYSVIDTQFLRIKLYKMFHHVIISVNGKPSFTVGISHFHFSKFANGKNGYIE